MAISPEDVEHVAALAHLQLSSEERDRMAHEIGGILEYVRLLDALDLSEIPPTHNTLEMRQPLRADEPSPSLSRQRALEVAPEEDGHFFIVPKVL